MKLKKLKKSGSIGHLVVFLKPLRALLGLCAIRVIDAKRSIEDSSLICYT